MNTRWEIEWGPNWDDDLAGTDYARQDYDLVRSNEVGRKIKMDMEDLFMRYLPRMCNHCLNPACVAACPSCPYKKVFYSWETNKSEKCTFCYPDAEWREKRTELEAAIQTVDDESMAAVLNAFVEHAFLVMLTSSRGAMWTRSTSARRRTSTSRARAAKTSAGSA